MRRLNFHVLGSGAIGSLLAFHLRKAQHEVTLLLRDARSLAAFQSQGSQLICESDGVELKANGFHAEAIQLPTRLPQRYTKSAITQAEDTGGTIQRLLVCTKAHDTIAAVRQLRERISSSGTIVLLQNGMGVCEEVCSLFPDEITRPNIALATTTHGSFRKNPFHAVHAGKGSIWLAAVPRPEPNPSILQSTDLRENIERLRALQSQSLATTIEALKNIHELDVMEEHFTLLQDRLLEKLVVNACINPLTALMNCRNGDLLNIRSTHELTRSICKEASEAIIASRMPSADALNRFLPDRLHKYIGEVCRSTASNYSSMLQDIRKGSYTEIDYINGYLYRLAAQHGVQAPVNLALWRLVKTKHKIDCKHRERSGGIKL
ncbi:uncharacterized protein VTP21DRAFT_4627 [Calcarisporiella thermophila]|uniref:uncharacterized protein n=1 Tax=Calcarisporiella thermophila TaxID=911321 RepID=UPI0037441FFD